ncbi:MAG: hypothetical protein GXP35_09795 [Actinobacteria bacterium]|nr:hypothetical protein [Actinomycetota bacterium]
MSRKFLLYSHDTYGLGHLRRNTTIAAALTAEGNDAEVLLISGSPRSASFPLPPRTDVVQLPSVTKSSAGRYVPRRLTGDITSVVELRAAVIDSAVAAYRPDVMLVDHSPAGVNGELRPCLARISADPGRPRLVLGLRDIIDDAAKVASQWSSEGLWDVLDEYDEIVVYGDPAVCSTATELGLAERCSAPVTHVGYTAPQCGPSRRPKGHGADTPLVVVTVGGGGDGFNLCARYLEFVAHWSSPTFRSVVVTGPLMSSRRRRELRCVAARIRANVEVVEHEPDLRGLLGEASAVVSMAGYNTAVELLTLGTPSLLVPRSFPRREQLLRAQRLAGVSHMDWCPLDELTTQRLARFVSGASSAPRESTNLDLNGAVNVANRLLGAVPAAKVPLTEILMTQGAGHG